MDPASIGATPSVAANIRCDAEDQHQGQTRVPRRRDESNRRSRACATGGRKSDSDPAMTGLAWVPTLSLPLPCVLDEMPPVPLETSRQVGTLCEVPDVVYEKSWQARESMPPRINQINETRRSCY